MFGKSLIAIVGIVIATDAGTSGWDHPSDVWFTSHIPGGMKQCPDSGSGYELRNCRPARRYISM